jgi:hypothetical protein
VDADQRERKRTVDENHNPHQTIDDDDATTIDPNASIDDDDGDNT